MFARSKRRPATPVPLDPRDFPGVAASTPDGSLVLVEGVDYARSADGGHEVSRYALKRPDGSLTACTEATGRQLVRDATAALAAQQTAEREARAAADRERRALSGPLLDRAEAAAFLGIRPDSVDRLRRAGRIAALPGDRRAYPMGGLRMYREAVEAEEGERKRQRAAARREARRQRQR